MTLRRKTHSLGGTLVALVGALALGSGCGKKEEPPPEVAVEEAAVEPSPPAAEVDASEEHPGDGERPARGERPGRRPHRGGDADMAEPGATREARPRLRPTEPRPDAAGGATPGMDSPDGHDPMAPPTGGPPDPVAPGMPPDPTVGGGPGENPGAVPGAIPAVPVGGPDPVVRAGPGPGERPTPMPGQPIPGPDNPAIHPGDHPIGQPMTAAPDAEKVLTLSAVLDVLKGKKLAPAGPLPGIAQQPGYSSVHYASADGKRLGVSVQIWQDPARRESDDRYRRMRLQYPKPEDVTAMPPAKAFFAQFAGVQILTFVDSVKRVVASVACGEGVCDHDQLLRLARSVRDRL